MNEYNVTHINKYKTEKLSSMDRYSHSKFRKFIGGIAVGITLLGAAYAGGVFNNHEKTTETPDVPTTENTLGIGRVRAGDTGAIESLDNELASLLESGAISEEDLDGINITYAGQQLQADMGGVAHPGEKFAIWKAEDGDLNVTLINEPTS